MSVIETSTIGFLDVYARIRRLSSGALGWRSWDTASSCWPPRGGCWRSAATPTSPPASSSPASDTNLASIGYHFGSKDGLLNAAIELSFHDWAEQLAGLVMSDTAATPLQRAAATWVASIEELPARRSMLQSYVEALAQGLRVPELRTQLAAHYARARTMVAELVAHTLGEGIAADDPRCRAVASLVIAACDGLAVQWLLDPEDAAGSAVARGRSGRRALGVAAGAGRRPDGLAPAGDLAHRRTHVGEVDRGDDGRDEREDAQHRAGPVGRPKKEPRKPAMTRISVQAGLVSLSAAGNAAALRVRQSTRAHTRSATRPQNSTHRSRCTARRRRPPRQRTDARNGIARLGEAGGQPTALRPRGGGRAVGGAAVVQQPWIRPWWCAWSPRSSGSWPTWSRPCARSGSCGRPGWLVAGLVAAGLVAFVGAGPASRRAWRRDGRSATAPA